ncbi:MAG: Arc family DNA-binding protein, partial [Propionibacteriales bacterium]|nr:Arc family DNA-binding protein [Propionibacteriales bacterium]
MNIDTYLESVRGGITNATALADDHSKDVAQRLGDAVESSVRLALIEALSDATAEISAEVAPASVEFRLSGGEPQFVVSAPPSTDDTYAEDDSSNDDPALAGEDEEQVRVTLRLPASIKKKVDEQASADGVSTNTWLLQRVLESFGRRGRGGRGGPWRGGPDAPHPPRPPFGPTFGPDFPFGPDGPFGPGGPFDGPAGPFGPGGPDGDRRHRGGRRRGSDRGGDQRGSRFN